MRKGVGKRILTAALALVTFLTSVPLSANAETYVVAGANYDTADATKLDNEFATAYLFDDGMLYVDSFKQSGDTSNYPWYNHKDEIKSLSFKDDIKYIGGGAFSGYTGITGELNLPSGLEEIKICAFANCTGLTGELVIPDNVKTIGELAFEHDKGFSSLKLGNSVETIFAAFYDCTGFTGELVIPDSCTWIKSRNSVSENTGAFQGCTGFTSLNLGNGVVQLDQYSFKDCTSLSGTINIPDSCVYIGGRSYVIFLGWDVKNYYGGVFENCENIEHVNISENVKYIGNDAFKNCKKLTGKVELPKNLTMLGEAIFMNCESLEEVDITSNTVTTLSNKVFENCYSLKRVNSSTDGVLNIPANYTVVGENTFKECYSLDVINFEGDRTSFYEGSSFYLSWNHRTQTTSNKENFIKKYGPKFNRRYLSVKFMSDGNEIQSVDINGNTRTYNKQVDESQLVVGDKKIRYWNSKDINNEEIKTDTVSIARSDAKVGAVYGYINTKLNSNNNYEIKMSNIYSGTNTEKYVEVNDNTTFNAEWGKNTKNNKLYLYINILTDSYHDYNVTETSKYKPNLTYYDDEVLDVIPTQNDLKTQLTAKGINTNDYIFLGWAERGGSGSWGTNAWNKYTEVDLSDVENIKEYYSNDNYNYKSLYAVYAKKNVKYTFINPDDDSELGTFTGNYGDTINYPDINNIAVGWSTDKNWLTNTDYDYTSTTVTYPTEYNSNEVKLYAKTYKNMRYMFYKKYESQKVYVGDFEGKYGDTIVFPTTEPDADHSDFIFKRWEDANGDVIDFSKVEYTGYEGYPFSYRTDIYAIYEEKPVYYKVTFNGTGGTWNNTEGLKYSTVLKNNKVEKPENPVRKGYKFEGWYKESSYTNEFEFELDSNSNKYISKEAVTSNMTLYAKYSAHWVTLSFDGKGGTFGDGTTGIKEQRLMSGFNAGKITDPVKEGYIFSGWYKDEECTREYEFEYDANRGYYMSKDPVLYDMTIYAKWEEVTYRVIFAWDGIPAQTVKAGNKVTKPSKIPESMYQDFVGWFKNTNNTQPWDFDNDVVTSDMTLYPKFEDSVYKVTFDVNGGAFEDGSTYVAPQTVTWEQHLTKPAKEPKKDGYKFAAWTADINNSILVPWNFPYYHVEHDMVLYARYFKVYIVKFETDGGSAIADQELVEKSGMTCKATKPSNPTKSGYKFIGWYTDDSFATEYEFSDQVTSDITLYAKWEVSNEPVNPAPSKKPDPEPEKPTPSDDPTPDKTPEPTVEPEKEQEVIIPTPTPTPTPTPAIEVIPENTNKPDPEPETKEPEPVVEEITEPEEVEESEEVVEYTPEIKPIVNEEEPLLIGSVDSDKVNEKGALGRWLEEHKVMVIVVSISIITVLIGLFILLLLLAWIKRVIVQNDKNTDDYSDENFETVYRTSVKSEGNIFDEMFKKSEVKVWTLKIPENIINERTTDQFKVVLNKHFCKRNNGGDLIIVINSDNEEERQDLKFVIDEEENEIRFTYEESK